MKNLLFSRSSRASSLGASRLARRTVLRWMGGVAISCWGCSRRFPAPSSISSPLGAVSASVAPACIVRPEQSAGPYFVDERADQRLNRSDIRSDPSDGLVKSGVPLRLVFQVSQVGDSGCTPLSNALVDVWHCDASGRYSDVNDPRFSTVGKKFLRGYQTTNADGEAEFLTIYPGWYPGRTVHIHFKIRTATQPSYEFTSQLYFDDALTDQVHAQAPYATGRQRTQNQQDGIFQQGGEELLLSLVPAESGYRGRLEIGLDLSD